MAGRCGCEACLEGVAARRGWKVWLEVVAGRQPCPPEELAATPSRHALQTRLSATPSSHTSQPHLPAMLPAKSCSHTFSVAFLWSSIPSTTLQTCPPEELCSHTFQACLADTTFSHAFQQHLAATPSSHASSQVLQPHLQRSLPLELDTTLFFLTGKDP